MNIKMEQPQPEISEVVKNAFINLKQRMAGQDLMFKDESGKERFFAISSPAGTINLYSYKTGLTYTLWEDGKMETGDDSNPDNIVNEPATQELNSMIRKIENLQEEKMEHPE